MDNLCHTLVGAAFGEAGLKRRTASGNVTLMIASNLPDVDVLVFATDLPSVAFRRGWTHGVLAQALLPVVLAGLMVLVGRLRRERQNHDSRGAALHRGGFAQLLFLSYIGVLTHVAMDWLNNYGVRLLMPFSGRWFYGDSVFIIDPWLWLTLGTGVWLARRWTRERPARIALLVATLYIAAMVLSARAARAIVLDRWRSERGGAPHALMVGPVPITPLRRTVIVDAGDHYETGTFTWLPLDVRFDAASVAKHDRDRAVAAARARDTRVRGVLVWARFPYFEIEPVANGTRVTVRDMRFGDRVGGVSTVVR